MAKRNVTLRTRSRKEKPEQPKKRNKQSSKQKQQHPQDQHSPTPPPPLMQRGPDGEWLISKALLDTPSPIHNHFIGMLHKDTLVNVRDGIQTLTTLLGLDNNHSDYPINAYIGAYWMMLNMVDALQFEIYQRDKLTPAQT